MSPAWREHGCTGGGERISRGRIGGTESVRILRRMVRKYEVFPKKAEKEPEDIDGGTAETESWLPIAMFQNLRSELIIFQTNRANVVA